MAVLQPLLIGAARRDCFLTTDDTLVQDAGTGPTVHSLSTGEQAGFIHMPWAQRQIFRCSEPDYLNIFMLCAYAGV